jgi:kinesin family protein 5
MVKKSARARAAARASGGPTNIKKSGGASAAGARNAAAADPASVAAQLYERAQIALAYGDPDSALDALREAVRLQPRDSALADAYAALLAETGAGGPGDALAALRRAVELSPDQGHEKYLYLAQLLPGGSDDAFAAAQKGVALLQAAVDALPAANSGGARRRKAAQDEDDAMDHDQEDNDAEDDEDEAEELRAQLSSALCALSEIVCERADLATAAAAAGGGGKKKASAPASAALPPEAAAEAESLLQRAQALAPESPEPLQALAALRYHRQGRADEALALLRRSLALWMPGGGGGGQGGGAAAGAAGAAEKAEEPQAAAAGDDDDDDLARLMRATAARQKPRTLSEAGTDAGDAKGGGGSADMGDDEADDDDGEWVTEGDEDQEDEPTQNLPPYELRFEAAKLLLELDETTDAAVAVLSGLLAEHDSEPDVWHLYALALYSGGAGSADTLKEASEAADHGRKLLEARRKALRRAAQGADGDEAVQDLDAAALAFEDLRAAIAEAQQALQSAQ